MAHIPIATVDNLAEADAIIFGTPTRFGNMCGQMRQFLDATGQLWMKGSLVGKIGSVFVSSATQHGGQGERMPSDNELAGARYQGAHVARIALKLKG